MKVMFSIDGYTAHYYIRLGVARVLKLMGHEIILWDINKKSVFDAFDEFEPDMFIGQTFNVNRALIKCLEERPHVRVIMKASDYGPAMEQMDLQKFPVLVANPNELALMQELKEKTGKPDFVLIHYHKDYVDQTHSYWKERLDIPYYGIMSAADITDYTNGEIREEYKTDVCFIGGYWPYKSRTLDGYILRLCSPGKNINIRVFGNQNWPIPQYCGNIDNDLVKHVLRSATICPNIHELHSQVYGWDIVERPFKLLSNKCFVVSDYVEGLAKIYPDEIIYANNPEEFEEKIRYFIKNPEARQPYIDLGFKNTIKKHTYFDRVAEIMSYLNLPGQANLAQIAKKDTLRRLGIESL